MDEEEEEEEEEKEEEEEEQIGDEEEEYEEYEDEDQPRKKKAKKDSRRKQTSKKDEDDEDYEEEAAEDEYGESNSTKAGKKQKTSAVEEDDEMEIDEDEFGLKKKSVSRAGGRGGGGSRTAARGKKEKGRRMVGSLNDDDDEFLPSAKEMKEEEEEERAAEVEEIDEDSEADVEELERDKPPCKYGADCYRRNPLHLAQFSHPHDKSQRDDNKLAHMAGSSSKRENTTATIHGAAATTPSYSNMNGHGSGSSSRKKESPRGSSSTGMELDEVEQTARRPAADKLRETMIEEKEQPRRPPSSSPAMRGHGEMEREGKDNRSSSSKLPLPVSSVLPRPPNSAQPAAPFSSSDSLPPTSIPLSSSSSSSLFAGCQMYFHASVPESMKAGLLPQVLSRGGSVSPQPSSPSLNVIVVSPSLSSNVPSTASLKLYQQRNPSLRIVNTKWITQSVAQDTKLAFDEFEFRFR